MRSEGEEIKTNSLQPRRHLDYREAIAHLLGAASRRQVRERREEHLLLAGEGREQRCGEELLSRVGHIVISDAPPNTNACPSGGLVESPAILQATFAATDLANDTSDSDAVSSEGSAEVHSRGPEPDRPTRAEPRTR